MNSIKILDGDKKNKLITLDIPIFLDDSIEIVKNKLYTLSHYLYPNFLALKINNIFNDSRKFIYEYSDNHNIEITIYNIISKNLNDTTFENISKQWTSLTQTEYTTIKISQQIKKELGDDTKDYKTLIKHIKTKQIKKSEFNKDKIININYNSPIIDRNADGTLKSKIISSIINYKLEQTLDLEKIFKHIELSKTIPLVIYKPRIKKEGFVKIYKPIKNIIEHITIKKWLLAKTTKNEDLMKGNKGLTIKFQFDNQYTNIHIYQNIITMKCIFEELDQNECDQQLKKIITLLEKILNKKIKVLTEKINNITTEIIINKYFDADDFLLGDYKLFFKIPKIVNKDSETIYLNYFRTYSEDGIDISIQDFQNRKKVVLKDISNEKQLYIIINLIGSLIENIDGKNIITKIQEPNIKKIKKEGGIVDSKSCQKNRQPIISDFEKPLDESYDLIYQNNRYICKNPKFKYPGFTNKNIPCCFINNQKHKKKYQELTTPLEQEIYPSNLPIEINGIIYMALKDTDDNYLYLDNVGKLHKITNNSIIEQINEAGDIWLKKINLFNLIIKPQKFKCNNAPSDVLLKQCPENVSHFGYTNEGYPCCYAHSRNIIAKKNQKDSKQHIIQTNKILLNDQIGIIPEDIQSLFEKNFYRHGIYQNNSSFLNAIAKTKNNNASSEKLREFIYKKLDKTLFQNLTGISDIYEYSEYKEYLLNHKKWLDHKLSIELVSIIFELNIIVLNYTKNVVSCYMNLFDLPFIKGRDYVVLIKQKKNYEPVFNNTNGKFRFQKKDVINIIKLYKFSCKIIRPENYPLTLKQIIKLYPNAQQIINKANYVNYVVYKDGLIPVKYSKPLKTLKNTEMIKVSAQKQIQLLENLDPSLKVIGQIVKSNKTIGLLIKSGLVIPVNTGNIIPDLDIVNINYYYNINEILQLNDKTEDLRIRIVLNRIVKDEYYKRIQYIISEKLKKDKKLLEYIKNIKNSDRTRKEKVDSLKIVISPLIQKSISNQLVKNRNIRLNTNKRVLCPDIETIEQCQLTDYCVWENSKCKLVLLNTIEDLIMNIIQSILMNNRIINGNIADEIVDSNNFIKRNTEIVLNDTLQISQWMSL